MLVLESEKEGTAMLGGFFFGGDLFGDRERWAYRFFERFMKEDAEEMEREAEEARQKELWPKDIADEFVSLAQDRERLEENQNLADGDPKAVAEDRDELIKRSVDLAFRTLGHIPRTLVGEEDLPLLTPAQKSALEGYKSKSVEETPAPSEEKTENLAPTAPVPQGASEKESAWISPSVPTPHVSEGDQQITPEPEME